MLYRNAGGLLLCKTGGLVDDKRERLSTEDGLLLVPQLRTADVLLTACEVHQYRPMTNRLRYMQTQDLLTVYTDGVCSAF